MKARRLLVLAILGSLAILLAALLWLVTELYVCSLKPGSAQETVELLPHELLSTFAYRLHQDDLLHHPKLFIAYARVRHLDRAMQAGEYAVVKGMSVRDLAQAIRHGRVLYYPFQIIEGERYAQIEQALLRAEKLVGSDEQADISAQVFCLDRHHLEGCFYPDTYFYVKGDKHLDLLNRAAQRMETVLMEEWSMRSNQSVLETPYEALILGSLIEKETALEQEMPMISGVLQRRLAAHMRLQVDPTVIYALGDQYTGILKRRDLAFDSPYNTYRYAGLPPGPISTPSRAAIRAALQPAEGSSYYYVADGRGGHLFSQTYDEHTQAIQQSIKD